MSRARCTGAGVLAAAALTVASLAADSPQTGGSGRPGESGRPGRPRAARGDEFTTAVLPFLEAQCFRCHGEDRRKAGLRLDTLSADFTGGAAVEPWLEVIEKLNAGEMPPEGVQDPPTAEETAAVAAWLSEAIAQAAAARLARRERLSLLRLSREEYEYTIRDLLGVEFDASDPGGLNEDERLGGFERIGPVLSVSPSHVEKYLAAAESILAEALPDSPPRSEHTLQSTLDLVGGPAIYGEERIARLEQEGRADDIRIDLWPGQLVRTSPRDSLPAGRYRVKLQVSGLAPRGGRLPHLTFYAETLDRLLFESDVAAAEEEPVVLEFEAHLPAGRHQFALRNDVPGPSILARLGRSGSRPFFSLAEGRIPWQVQLTGADDRPLYPLLVLDWVEWEGPLPNDDLAIARPAADADLEQLAARLETFAPRAFRRPLREAELEPYVALVAAELESGSAPLVALRSGLTALLCSHEFLYLTEGAPHTAVDERVQLNDWELASRLSYFLWSTMPDDELFGLARAGRLRAPDVLRAQVRRMLSDPRSKRFAHSFARQWLELDRVGMFPPDAKLYPEYDEYLGRSMVAESMEFFDAVLRQNGGLREFLASDWTMLNARLARHYGIGGAEGTDAIRGDAFRRVSLAPEHHRGGLLTQASVLSLTSDGTRHRPVHRGVWLAEAILGRTPPPPPANVEPIEPVPATSPKATVRAQLEDHVRVPSCAACHKNTDPYGFAFENYDALGRWRTHERVPTGTGGDPPVDASGTLPDGRSFTNATDLQRLLLDDVELFADAFTRKLASYALRRPTGVDDRAELERIAAAGASDYRLRELIQELVLSDLFLRR